MRPWRPSGGVAERASCRMSTRCDGDPRSPRATDRFSNPDGVTGADMGVPVSEVLASLVAVVDATAMPDVRRVEDARDWVTGESAQLTALLHRHGAVLLRGLPIDGAE